MGVTNRLIFDPTDANSVAASSTIGAHILSGTDGSQIGHETLNSVDWLRVAGALVDSAGNEVAVTGNALDVNIASGSLSTAYSYAEDSAFTEADEGVHNLTVRQDTLATSTSADGDYASMKSDSLGRIYMTDDQVLAELQGGIDVTVQNANIEVTQGTSPWVVSATDLDIRDLDSAQDSVAAWLSDGSGNAIGSTAGALDVNIASGDVDDDLADTAIENTATAVSTTAVNVVSSALSGRKWMYLANEGNKTLYFGKNGVTTANGFPMHAGMQMEVRIGPSVAPQIIGGTGASSEDLRVMELS